MTPAGDTWCMKSASQTYESLKDLGRRLQPAPGWKFRAVMLGQDLVLTRDDGAVKITQDELGNTYDRGGGPDSNYHGTTAEHAADKRRPATSCLAVRVPSMHRAERAMARDPRLRLDTEAG
jgi:hypothetical protein